MLDELVAYATDRKIVVQLIVGNGTGTQNLSVVGTIAARYKHNPRVWLNPDNEINCYGIRTCDCASLGTPTPSCQLTTPNGCTDSSVWSAYVRNYVGRARGEGFVNPIVLNGLDWGADEASIAPLLPSDPSLILGAHVYADSSADFDAAAKQAAMTAWGSLAATYPVIVDEVGYLNTGLGFVPEPLWSDDFLRFAASWVTTMGGAGVTGFTWFGTATDPNNLVDEQGALSSWGALFLSNYVNAVPHALAD
jgi:hypothetical protein